MSISSRYNPADTEDKWYQHWMSNGYFKSTPDDRESYSIVIPPPNVTGVLHMGHMLNNTIQDVLVRKARLEGKNACWVPGTDHASIATEAKVVKMLRERGIKKSDLTREKFLEYAWEWKDKYGGIILEQLKKLGASCDWDRTSFTMDEPRSEAVIKAFVDLYKKGSLYRRKRMVNWDPEAKTVLSNEEVIYHDEQSNLYHVSYQIEGSKETITIATTRPETILGDSAIAVHPEDERYAHLRGKRAIVPIVNRSIPIIFDDYVDMAFGTGGLKVTPAHDVNDYEIGQRHNLEIIDVLNEDGTMSEMGGFYIGDDRFEARKKIVKDLKASDQLLKIEQHTHSVGRSERTNSVVEPRLSLQWYVDMKGLAEPALKSVIEDDIEFFPKNKKNLYKHWMENIRDWCISRQLWWGHQIPAWYIDEEVFVATSEEEALKEAQAKFPDRNISLGDLKRDEDALDTWFSSWLWPISVFDGFNNRAELDYYYPTSVLVTGWDIIFLWVARMAMAGFEWEGKKPFDHVYFTGMVRDKQRRKMSKSLGNSPDALKLIEKFGADGVRFGMLSCSPAGGDLLFDEKLCEQGRNFANKIWNALRLVKGWEVDPQQDQKGSNKLAFEWFEAKMDQILIDNEANFKEYRLSESLMNLYSFVWNDFCSWLLEMIKPSYGEKIDAQSKEHILGLFEKICIMLHPFMPFLTEEAWHQIKDRATGEDCMMSQYPKGRENDKAKILASFETLKEIVSKIRDIRNKQGLKLKEILPFSVLKTTDSQAFFNINGLSDLIKKLANCSDAHLVDDAPQGQVSFVIGTDKYFLDALQEGNESEQLKKLEKDLQYQIGFVGSIEKKLSNQRFVNNAPSNVVDNERKKLADGLERIKMLKESIDQLK